MFNIRKNWLNYRLKLLRHWSTCDKIDYFIDIFNVAQIGVVLIILAWLGFIYWLALGR